MTVRHAICALAVSVAAAASVGAVPEGAQARSEDPCFYAAPSYQPSQVGWKAIQCYQARGWWVDGSSVRLLAKLSPDAVKVQMTRGLQARAIVDWDPRYNPGSICCTQEAGWHVTILP